MEENEVWLFGFSVMFNYDEQQHEETDEIGDESGSFSDLLDVFRCYGQGIRYAQKGIFVIFQLIVPFYLLLELLKAILQLDEFVPSGCSADFEHYRVSSVCSQVRKYGVSGEVHVLETHHLSVIWCDFDRKDEVFESLDKGFDVFVLVVLDGNCVHFFSEVFSLDSFFAFWLVGSLDVGSGCFFLPVGIVINFLENNQHVYNVADFRSKFFAFCTLLNYKFGNCSVVESGEYLSDEGFLNEVFSVLQVILSLALYSAVHVLLFKGLFDLLTRNPVEVGLGPKQSDHILSDHDPQIPGLALV